jgi:hypothetical protein
MQHYSTLLEQPLPCSTEPQKPVAVCPLAVRLTLLQCVRERLAVHAHLFFECRILARVLGYLLF